MDLDLLRLAESLSKKPKDAEPLGLRYGVIASTSAGPPPTVGVYIAGAPQETPGLAYLSSYAPVVGEIVVLMKQGGDLWVIGSHGGEAGEGGGGGGGGSGSGGGHGPKNGRGLYTGWTYPDPGASFYAWDSLIRIDDAPLPTDPDPAYFWSHQYSFVGGGAAYLGLQCGGPGQKNQCLWSVWDSVPASIEEFAVVSGSPPGSLDVIAHPFDGEGIGQSLQLLNAWQNGHENRMRLYSLGDDGHGDGSQWFRLYFADLTAAWEVQVGKICNEPGKGLISASGTTNFFEPYGGPEEFASDFRYAAAVIHRPVGNPFEAIPTPAVSSKTWEWGLSDTWPVGRFEATGPDPWSDVRHEFGIMSL